MSIDNRRFNGDFEILCEGFVVFKWQSRERIVTSPFHAVQPFYIIPYPPENVNSGTSSFQQNGVYFVRSSVFLKKRLDFFSSRRYNISITL